MRDDGGQAEGGSRESGLGECREADAWIWRLIGHRGEDGRAVQGVWRHQ